MDLESLFGRGLLHQRAPGDCNNTFRHSSGAADRAIEQRLFRLSGTRRWRISGAVVSEAQINNLLAMSSR